MEIKLNTNKSKMVVIMMNPSRANMISSDETVNAAIEYASRKGFGSLLVLNSIPVYELESQTITHDFLVHYTEECRVNLCIIKEIVDGIEEAQRESYELVLATGNPLKSRISIEAITQIHRLLKGKNVTCFKKNGKHLSILGYTFHPSRPLFKRDNETTWLVECL